MKYFIKILFFSCLLLVGGRFYSAFGDDIHSKDGKFYAIVERLQQEKSIDELVKIIDNTPNGKTARLLSCNDEAASIALSQKTQKPFYASDGWVEITNKGNIYSKNDFHLYSNGNKGAKTTSGYTKGEAPNTGDKLRLGDEGVNGISVNLAYNILIISV